MTVERRNGIDILSDDKQCMDYERHQRKSVQREAHELQATVANDKAMASSSPFNHTIQTTYIEF